jgi:hypothetical protein
MCPIRWFLCFGTDARKLGSIAAACGRRRIFSRPSANLCQTSRLDSSLLLIPYYEKERNIMSLISNIRSPRIVGLVARSRRSVISQSRWNTTQPPVPEKQVSPHVRLPLEPRAATQLIASIGRFLQDICAAHRQGSPNGHLYVSIGVLGMGEAREGRDQG